MLFFSSKPNPYLNDPDVVLMMAFKNGDKGAFDLILKNNYKRTFGFVARMLSDETAAEDLTQEVFIKLYKMASSYQPRSKLSTLLFRMARNAALNELRQRKVHVSMDQDNEGEENLFKKQMEDASATHPGQQLEQEELAQQVRLAVEALPQNQRAAVILRRYEGMSYEEIARAMKATPKAVKSLLNRAKENLRESLKSCI